MLDQACFIGAPNTYGEFPVLDENHELLFNVDLDTAVLLTRTSNVIDKTSLVDLCPPELRIHPQLSIENMVKSFYDRMTQQRPLNLKGWFSSHVDFAIWKDLDVHEAQEPSSARGGPKKTLPKKLRPNPPRYSGTPEVSLNIIKARDHRKTV